MKSMGELHPVQASIQSEEVFLDRISGFLDPEAEMDAAQQLAIATELWCRLGHAVPQPDDRQMDTLESALEDDPTKRVVPAPLLDQSGRKQIGQEARKLPRGDQYSKHGPVLWTPLDSESYPGQYEVLRHPNKNSEWQNSLYDGDKKFGLRYKTPDGELVKHKGFKAHLLEAGKAIQGDDESVWTYPVMDVQATSERTDEMALNLHAAVEPTVIPESLIVVRLLHHANGTPITDWEVDFANEAMYELKPAFRKAARLACDSIAAVSATLDKGQLSLGFWQWNRRDASFGIREAVSGL